MKKLLFIPIIGAFAWLASFGLHIYPTVKTPTEIIQQAHDAFPSVPAMPKIIVPTFNPVQPKAKHVRPVKPRVLNPPPVPYVAEEPPADDVQLECIWPLRLIPGCRPQESGSQP